MFIASATVPCGIAVDDNFVYWGNGGITKTIGRANISGTGINQSFISNAKPCNMILHGKFIYWGNFDTAMIGKATIDGSSSNPNFISTTPDACGVAIGPEN